MKKLIKIFLCLLSINLNASEKTRILVGSPVRQKPAILHEFLTSLIELRQENIQMDYYFIDDNTDSHATDMLKNFEMDHLGSCIVKRASQNNQAYLCNETTHYWKDSTIWKVAAYKDAIIEYAKYMQYDYLFLIDSDIVLHPDMMQHLVNLKKDIISEIFWTKWMPDSPLLPQVWLYDQYTQYQVGIAETISEEEKSRRFGEFINMLRLPGVYEVGGLGACTLISKKALDAGVHFKKIKNITFWGEDRHFCIRASALGFPLYVDTFYPAYHIYRESDLAGVASFKTNYEEYLRTI